MAEQGFGSSENPVRLWPWSRIVEVGWAGGYVSEHGISFSATSNTLACTGQPVVPGVGFPGGSAALLSLTFTPANPAASFPGVISLSGSGPVQTKSGTFFNFPTRPSTFSFTSFQYHNAPSSISGEISGSGLTIRAAFPQAENLKCLDFSPTFIQGAEIGQALEVGAHHADFGGVSFIETDTGEEYAFGKMDNLSVEVGVGITARIHWQKVS